MKKFLKIFIVALLLITLIPIKADAAKTKYVIKADVVYEIHPEEKITLYVDSSNKITWNTSNKKVATVSSKGVVTGKKPGNATITATVGKKKYKCKIQVWSREEVIMYNHDIAKDSKDKEISPKPDTKVKTDKTKNASSSSNTNKDLDGIESSFSGKTSEADNSTEADELITSDKTPEWADEYYLENKYDFSVNWLGEKLYIMGINDKYIITGSPKGKFEIDKIYEGEYNGFKVRFKMDKNYELSFNYSDLKNSGIIS